ncbi:FAD-dependent oxidoreductase [Nonomuraea salmonea]|uniref:FAD-dependent oxidoreductase n=1 Tax=Nonomuraea salmonea TaxID=46181 RepID=UPI0031EEE613
MTVAERVARAGPTVAVVEERLVGGECNYYGCVPSKAMLWPMEIAADVSRMPGLELGGPIDAAAVLDRREEFVSHFDDSDYVSGLNDLPATFVRGRGRLSGPSQVAVRTPDGGTLSLRAGEAVVLATGSTPRHPRHPRVAGGAPVDEPGGHQRAAGARAARGHRRRAGRLRDGPGPACPRRS